MPKINKGRNGGILKSQQKGDPALPGAGRPLGAKTFRRLLEEALERTMKDKEGKEISLKEASALQMVAMLLSPDTEDNTKLRVFQLVRDTIGEAPIEKSEISGPSGGEIQVKNIIIEIPKDGGNE